MNEINEKNMAKHKPWKKAMCVLLSVIIAFGTLITLTVGSSRLQDWLGIKSMLSAYAAEIVDTTGAVAVDEESMLADNNVIDLENSDGSNTIYLFSEPISFTDENGNLKTKDISVEKQSDRELKKQGYTYTNGQNDYRINFSEDSDKGLLVEFNGCSYTIIPQGKFPVDGEKNVSENLNREFEIFEYENIYGVGTSLKFYPQLNGVKDEIVLNSNTGQNAFSFELKTENCTASLNDDGTVTLINENGENVQTFSAPFAYDSEYVEGDLKNEHYSDCAYSLEQKEDNTYILTVTVDKDWMESESTVYPIVIDPTTSNISNYKDAGIYSSATSRVIPYGNEATCCFGRTANSEYGYGRVLNYFSWPSAIKKGAAINSAYIWERETTGRTTTTYVAPCLVSEHWVEGSVTWENRPGYYSSTTMARKNINSKSTDKSGDPYWYKFNIASAVKYWADGTYHNYGLLFRSSEEEDKNYNWRAFASKQHSTSAYRPYTVINYTNDATAPTVTSVTGNATFWTSSNVTLTVNGAKDNSGGVGLHSTPYSFSTTKGSYSWQASKSKTFSSNCTVYVYVRDAWDNVRLVSTQTISKIDKSAPTYTSVTGNAASWTNSNVTLKVNGATDAASGLHSTAYSFTTTSGSYSWQSGNTKTVSSNGTYYIYIRDAVGNIRSAGSVNVSKIDKTSPVISDVTVQKDSETKQTTVTITASDSLSGIAGYSFDGGATWQTANSKVLDSVSNSISVAVKDNAGNIATDVSDTILPEFYEDGALIGIYNPNTDSNETMQYKIGEDGEWIDYYVPFALPVDATINVYARMKSSDIYTSKQYTSQAYDYLGIYSVTETDLTISYENISFDLSRYYNSKDNKWFFSVESNVEKINDNILKTVMVDSNELIFVKQNDNLYHNETYGYELSVLKNSNNMEITGYAIFANDFVYYYDKNGLLTSVADAFDNSINFIYSENRLVKITYGTDEIREYIINTDIHGKITSIITPLGEKLIYEYSDSNLTDVYYDKDTLQILKNDDIILGHYEYSDNQLTICNSSEICYNANKLSRVTNSDGSYIDYSISIVNDSEMCEEKSQNDLVFKLVSTTSSGKISTTYYNNALNIIKYDDTNDVHNLYEYDIYQNLIYEKDNSITATYNYEGINLVSSVIDGTTTTYNEYGNKISEKDETNETTYSYLNDDGKTLEKIETVTSEKNGSIVNPKVTYSFVNNYQDGKLQSSTEIIVDSITDNSGVSKIQYNDDNTVKSITTESSVYDENNMASTEKETTSFLYDEFGNIQRRQGVIEKDNETEVSINNYEYDELNRNIKVTDNSGTTEQEFIYDPVDNTIYQNINQNVSRTIYDEYSRTVRRITNEDYNEEYDGLKKDSKQDYYSDDSAGYTYTYDENGNVQSETDRMGLTTTYSYYENSSNVKTESFDSYIFTYDENGNTIKETISGQLYAEYKYNDDNNPILTSYGNGQSIRYIYDDNGNLIAQYHNDDDSPYIEYTYNKISENQASGLDTEISKEAKVEINGNSDYILTSKTNYDTGQKTMYKDNIATVYSLNNKKLYSYDVEIDENSNTNSHNYTYASNCTVTTDLDDSIDTISINNANGTTTVTTMSDTVEIDSDNTVYYNVISHNGNSVLGINYAYDDNGNVISEEFNANGKEINYTYTYDENGRMLSYSTGDNYKVSYHYDEKTNALLSENIQTDMQSLLLEYSYDSRGNMLTRTQSEPGEYSNTIDYNVGTNSWYDELTSADGLQFLYDEIGNPVSINDLSLEWSSGRLLDCVYTANSDGTKNVFSSYTYDEKGIRTSKTYSGVTTYFTTRDGCITSQYQLDDAGMVINEIIFIYDTNNQLIGFTYDNGVYYYLKNHMNDVLAILDENGNIIVEYSYDAWGIPSVTNYYGDDADVRIDEINPMLYRGYYYDWEFGAYYLQSRYYFPIVNRFLNADIPEFAHQKKNEYAGANLFAYCNNNPVNKYDSNGTWANDVHNGYNPDTKNHFYYLDFDGVKEYYGTYYWAKMIGYSDSLAYLIGSSDNFVDEAYGSTGPNWKEYDKLHFYTVDGKDVRFQLSYSEQSKAKNYLNAATQAYYKYKEYKQLFGKNHSYTSKQYGLYKMNLDSGVTSLGFSLHPIQDAYAHTRDVCKQFNTIFPGRWYHATKSVDKAELHTYAVLGPTASKTLGILLTFYNSYYILRLERPYLI